MRGCVLSIASLIVALSVPACAQAAPSPRAVLVTGASSGLGRKITERLAADGYFVYAGARKDEDLKRLNLMRNVQGIRLDVTRPTDIEAAVSTITKAGRGLYGLVNNAGVVTVASVVKTKPEEFDLVMGVNVYGPWRMTRSLAALIVAARGRITNIGSIQANLREEQLSAYVMSKDALEGFTDTLAREMAPLGVEVSIVDPGSYNSDIVRNQLRRTGEGAEGADRSGYKEPDEVAAAVERALFEAHPQRRYMVVPNAQQAELTVKAQLQQLVELNEGQPYTYDRAALIKMLDETLAHSRPRTP
jgi:NAD(P)-dependent dehydrogenase (short-subunit alcohol dehydrogenase family)